MATPFYTYSHSVHTRTTYCTPRRWCSMTYSIRLGRHNTCRKIAIQSEEHVGCVHVRPPYSLPALLFLEQPPLNHTFVHVHAGTMIEPCNLFFYVFRDRPLLSLTFTGSNSRPCTLRFSPRNAHNILTALIGSAAPLRSRSVTEA